MGRNLRALRTLPGALFSSWSLAEFRAKTFWGRNKDMMAAIRVFSGQSLPLARELWRLWRPAMNDNDDDCKQRLFHPKQSWPAAWLEWPSSAFGLPPKFGIRRPPCSR